ncbi:MAG TPA: caspase family protein [candidate division Zixibacteria bacterium]|nr:caspase family protein [candidate division Zixibacteria bacterium]
MPKGEIEEMMERCGATAAPDYRRRLLLKAGLAAGMQLLLPRWCAAQSTLLALPKVALVFGNGGYKDAPLKNPANDARAMAAALKAMGFAVTMRLDARRAEMEDLARAYVQQLAKRKTVGLFYYAGHGVQLAWRNYMVPVDAAIETAADIQKQAVDVNSLLEGIKRTNNAMNVIILDACRDNPFGSLKGVDQKGLSQMDAPPSTLLAYATSPGNVASDGTGEHGLYTEYLLREMKVPEAKVEDVFKRVRLAVRRRTNGAQIPWESTSLEEDFYFLPPAHLKKLSEEEKERQFQEELALWEKVKDAKEPAPLETYLQRYPSGEFSELAQLRLDAVLAGQGEKRIDVASQAGNLFSHGFIRADTNYKVGDFYSYRLIDLAAQKEIRTIAGVVTAVKDNEVIIGHGEVVLDLMGNPKKSADGYRYTDNQNVPVEFYVGRKWSTRFQTFPPNLPRHVRLTTDMEYRIAGRETVTVPAGTFDCFRVEGRGVAVSSVGPASVQRTAWYAPERVRRFVAQELIRTPPARSPNPPVAERYELVAFKQT